MYTKRDLSKYKAQLEFAHKMGDVLKEKHLEQKIEEIKAYLDTHEEEVVVSKAEQERLDNIKMHSWKYQKAQLLKAGITPVWYTYKVVFYSDNKLEIKELYNELKNGMDCINSYTGQYGGITFESIIGENDLDASVYNDAGYIDGIEDFSSVDNLSNEAKQKLILEAIMTGKKVEDIKYDEANFDGNSFYTIQKVIQQSFLEVWDAFLQKEYPQVKYMIEKGN